MDCTDIYSFFLTHGNGAKIEHYVKLRPGLKEFLAELSNIFDMHIYTHGTREYALEIVKIIDPDQSLFRQRIVARTDTPETVHKSLKLLFPSCNDSMIIVLDDRVDVWKVTCRFCEEIVRYRLSCDRTMPKMCSW